MSLIMPYPSKAASGTQRKASHARNRHSKKPTAASTRSGQVIVAALPRRVIVHLHASSLRAFLTIAAALSRRGPVSPAPTRPSESLDLRRRRPQHRSRSGPRRTRQPPSQDTPEGPSPRSPGACPRPECGTAPYGTSPEVETPRPAPTRPRRCARPRPAARDARDLDRRGAHSRARTTEERAAPPALSLARLHRGPAILLTSSGSVRHSSAIFFRSAAFGGNFNGSGTEPAHERTGGMASHRRRLAKADRDGRCGDAVPGPSRRSPLDGKSRSDG